METIKRWIILFVFVTCVAGLAACATSPTTPTETVATAAPTVTTRPSPTPTSTRVPPPALTHTPIPTYTPNPSVTPDIVATVIAISQPRIYSPLLSLDGKWRAEIIIYDCVPVNRVDQNAYEELRLVEISTGVETVIDTQLQNCGGLGAAGLANLFWSPTSRYLYYTQTRDGYPDGCGYWERPITRLDLASQSIQQLGSGPLSPDRAKIATWQWPEKELAIWAVDGGEFARVSAHLPDANIGPIAWSPDSRSLVYLQSELDCYAFGNTYLIHLDLSTLKQELLLESKKPSWGGVIWESPNQLTLIDENGKEWRYNLITKKLEPES